MSLRIGLFVMTFPQLSETFIVTKFLKLLDAGFDVHVFAAVESAHWEKFSILAQRPEVRARVHVLSPSAPLSRVATRGGLDLARTIVTHPLRFARLARHSWTTRQETPSGFLRSLYLRNKFAAFELDILHVEFDAQGVGIADLRDFFGCRTLLSARGTFQQLSTMDTSPRALAYLFRYADGYHFISKFLEDNTHQLGLSSDVPTWLIEPAIDLSLFQPVPRESTSHSLRVISVGRLSWEKGYEIALAAIAELRSRGVDVTYTIYGAGPHEDPVRYAIKQFALADCVTFASLPRDQMPSAYANADVMLHTALAEGFCNAVIEAQAMELPVVVSDAGGLPENVEHGVTGYVVPRRDVTATANRLEELARDPVLRRRFGVAGRERARARFDLDRQAEAFVRLYRELAARK